MLDVWTAYNYLINSYRPTSFGPTLASPSLRLARPSPPLPPGAGTNRLIDWSEVGIRMVHKDSRVVVAFICPDISHDKRRYCVGVRDVSYTSFDVDDLYTGEGGQSGVGGTCVTCAELQKLIYWWKCRIHVLDYFMQRDAMLAPYMLQSCVCLSVRLSVRHSKRLDL